MKAGTKKERTKKQYPEDLKSLLGFSLPGMSIAYSAVIYGIFLQYLTDYSGIDDAIGVVGYAASFGTVFLVVSRIIDAVDDPLQAWLMDNAKERPFGKYRLCTLIGILLICFGMVAMFAIPAPVKANAVLLGIWIFAWYLVYDMGSALNGITAILQKATTDFEVRTKVMTWHRMFLILGAVPAMFFVPIATAINASIGNMGESVSLTCTAITLFSTVVSLIGIALLREPYQPKGDDEEKKPESEKVRLKDIGAMLRTNKAMWVHNIGFVVGNLAYGFASAMLVYFLKWYYCADISTGAVDNAAYAQVYGFNSILAIVSAIAAPLVAGIVTKKIGSTDRSARICLFISGCGYLVLGALFFLGVLRSSPVLYIVCNFLVGLPTSMATIPFLLLNVEVADYSEYRTGKNMTALTTALNNMLSKGTSALGAAIIGAILIAVSYSVDSVTGSFTGDVSVIPGMVQSFAIFMTIIPGLLCFASWAIYRFAYPITPELREEMTRELNARHAAEEKRASADPEEMGGQAE